MKNKILFASALLAVSLSSCNDDYSDQFNVNSGITDVKNLTLTLASTDYATVASNSANQSLALAKDPENKTYVTALNALKDNKYFTDMATAEDYLPAFIDVLYPNADNGSKAVITYNQNQGSSKYMGDFGSMKTYQLTANDYKTVWGDKVDASFLSPASVNKIPAILKSNMASPSTGDMAVVSYAYSDVEPSIGGGSSEVTYDKISDVVANVSGAEYTVKGEVVATYARGFLLSDGTASILVYLNATPNYAVGDVVTVSGTTTKYSNLMQFPNTSEITLVERKASFAYPSATSMTGAELDSWTSNASVKYVSYKGTLSISGSYVNIEVDGATHKGSVQYAAPGLVDEALNGKDVIVTGYLIGYSSGYINTMATSVVAADGSSAAYTPVGIITLSEPGAFDARGMVVATYARGFLLNDGTGSILVYLNKASDYAVGDIVTVSGTTSSYAGLKQYPAASVVTKIGTGTYKAPNARELAATDMEAYLEAPYAALVSYEGTLSISGSYYNVTIDGTTAVQGSLSYPISGSVDASLDGQKVMVTGYSIGVSSGKYFNTMITSVVAATKALNTRASRAAAIAPNASALYVYDGSAWSAYSNDNAKVAVVDPSVYASLGTDYLAAPDMTIPTYLNNKYPYALKDDRAVVVYEVSSGTAAADYVYGESGWVKASDIAAETITLSKEDDVWSAKMSTYLESTFLGTDGGFKAYDVALDGLTYVWTNTSSYGWKASGYSGGAKTTESYLISPVLNFKNATAPELSFQEAINFLATTVDNYVTVEVSTDFNGNVSTATWKKLALPARGDGSSYTYVDVNGVDLTEFVGKQVVIAFHYTSDSTYASTWEIKNFSVKERVAE